MIAATRIGIPEQDRPDLFVPLWGSWEGNETLWQTLVCPQLSPGDCNDHCDPQLMFLIPGTRREKLTKALWEAMDEMPRPPVQGDMAEYGIRMLAWSRQVDAARAALLALDAEGVKG